MHSDTANEMKHMDEYVEMLRKPACFVDRTKLLSMSKSDVNEMVSQLNTYIDKISMITNLLWMQTDLLNRLVKNNCVVDITSVPTDVNFITTEDGRQRTVVSWSDGAVTSATTLPQDEFDPIQGINICLAERIMRSKNQLRKLYKKYAGDEYAKQFGN